MAKSAIMTTANTQVRDSDSVTPANPFAMGSGQVNPGVVADRARRSTPVSSTTPASIDYLGFLCDEDDSIFADPQATCPLIEGAGTAMMPWTSTTRRSAWRHWRAPRPSPDG